MTRHYSHIRVSEELVILQLAVIERDVVQFTIIAQVRNGVLDHMSVCPISTCPLLVVSVETARFFSHLDRYLRGLDDLEQFDSGVGSLF